MEKERFYQPRVEFGGREFIPEELYSYQVFKDESNCKSWLQQHGYDLSVCNIHEYNEDDIPAYTYINSDGDEIAINYLDMTLNDDDSECGGKAFADETLRDFLDDMDKDYDTPMYRVNEWLEECGIEPIEI